MKYNFTTWEIQKLVDLIKGKKIDLQPPYQRNFIWGKTDQQLLINSIEKGYPLPAFFVYKKSDNSFEMVDGQQRSETIYRFVLGKIIDLNKRNINEIDKEKFLNYKLPIIEISEINESDGNISDFYALVNKRGKHLNASEVNKAQYAQSPFLQLAEKIVSSVELVELDIFSDSAKNRMNDRSLIEEILAYLHDEEITDKRVSVTTLFDKLSEDEAKQLELKFNSVVGKIMLLNKIQPLKNNRFKQRNDFFSLFCFIHKHINESDELLTIQYKILCWIDQKNYIRPSNEDCDLFNKYALNCVSQSNSAIARKKRLEILETILLHCSGSQDSEYNDMIEFISDDLGIDVLPTITIEKYNLIDISKM